MATLQRFSRSLLNLRRSAARTITGANLKLENRKKIYVIYMSVVSEPRIGDFRNIDFCVIDECLNKIVQFPPKKYSLN